MAPIRGFINFILGLFGRSGRRVSAQRAERWLRIVSTLFFFALLIPVGILIDTIYSQLDNEALYQLRVESERLNEQVNRKLSEVVAAEENRPFNDYSFFNVTELPLVQQKRLAISPLAHTDPANAPAGLVGYFQVDPAGGFSSPVVPSTPLSDTDIQSLGISSEELLKRTSVRDGLYAMLFSGETAGGGTGIGGAGSPVPQFTELADKREFDSKKDSGIPADSEGRFNPAGGRRFDEAADLPAEKSAAEHAGNIDAAKGNPQPSAAGNLNYEQKAKQQLTADLSNAQPEQFLNRNVGTFQGQKVADLNLESKWATKLKESPSTLAQVDRILSKSSDSFSSRKKVVVDTAAPENTTRDLYASYGSVAQEAAKPDALAKDSEKREEESGPRMKSRPVPVRRQPQPQSAAAVPSAEVADSAQTESQSGRQEDEQLRYRQKRPIGESSLAVDSTPAQNQLRAEQRGQDRGTSGRINQPAEPGVKILSFEAEIEPFRARALPEKRIVFFRNVWRENRRYIQGFVVDGPAFLRQILDNPVASSSLESFSNIIVSYSDEVFETIRSYSAQAASASASKRELLISSDKLSSPLNNFGLLITAGHLPQAPGRRLVDILTFGLLGIVLVGQWALYTIARKQIRLAKERSDFVSAVSHELKTPLTSIRMYSEMLREGWVGDEAKKHSYYDFIFRESERLSRLISNVLDFSRLSNSPQAKLELKRIEPLDLYNRARERIAAMIGSAGFKLEEAISFGSNEIQAAPAILADEDSFIRIIINLVDNAVKFSAQAPDKRVVFGLRLRTGGQNEVVFSVRDFGPGVAREKMKKIFTLFYRGTDEMTRTTQGTGIGLALVKELAEKMGARVDLSNQDPGAQFEVVFKVEKNS